MILEPLLHPTLGELNSAGRPHTTRAPTSDATAGKVRPGLWRALDPEPDHSLDIWTKLCGSRA